MVITEDKEQICLTLMHRFLQAHHLSPRRFMSDLIRCDGTSSQIAQRLSVTILALCLPIFCDLDQMARTRPTAEVNTIEADEEIIVINLTGPVVTEAGNAAREETAKPESHAVVKVMNDMIAVMACYQA